MDEALFKAEPTVGVRGTGYDSCHLDVSGTVVARVIEVDDYRCESQPRNDMVKKELQHVPSKIVPFLENASHHCSVLTLLAIGFERYYAICHPLRETVGSRVASTSVLIPAVWVVSCLVSVPFAIISNIKVSTYYDDTLVNTCRTDMSSKLSRAYIIFISVAFLALPLLLLTALYSAIIRTLRASTKLTPESTFSSSNNNSTLGRQCLQQNSIRNARAMASRRQVIRMMVGVMSLYFLCLFPLRCVQLWLVFGKEQDLVKLGFVGYLNLLNCVRILVYVNSAGNPIIYGLLSSNFREAFKQSCFKRRSSQINTGQHNRYYSSYNHHNPYRQPPETTVMTTHFGQEAAISTDIHMEENGKPTETNRSSRIVPSHPSRSNSVCSENCVDKLIAPLLNQAVSVDSDGVTPGYTQTKLGLAYI